MEISKKSKNSCLTLFERINWMQSKKQIDLEEAISIIRDGNYRIENTNLKTITEFIQHQTKETDLQELKLRYLPAVSFNGIYGNNGIETYSSVTAIDFDHIPNQETYTNLFLRLVKTPCVAVVFRSPSGKGIKALVLHDNTNPMLHGNLYQQLMQMFSTPEIATDTCNRDLSRRTYLCYDPDIWTNSNPTPFHFVYDASLCQTKVNSSLETKPTMTKECSTNANRAEGISDNSIMYMLRSKCKRFHSDYLCEGGRHDGVFWFGTQASKAGVDYDLGLDFVRRLYNSNEIKLTSGGGFSEKEICENYKNGYGKESYNETYRSSFRKK